MSIRRRTVAAVIMIGVLAVGYGVAAARATHHSKSPAVGAPAPRLPHFASRVRSEAQRSAAYHPVTNCRIVDTRGHGGPIGAGASRSYFVVGTTGFSGQGGHANGCNIPVGATSIEARLTAFGPTTTGVFRAYPTGHIVMIGTLFYTAHQSTTTAAAINLAAGSGKVLTVKNDHGKSNLFVDVTGYYRPEIEGLVYTGSNATSGSVYSGSPSLVSVTWISTGVADVTLDRDVTYCTPIAGGYYDSTYFANAKAFTTNKIRVFSWYYNTSTHLMTPVNNYVYLQVVC